MAQDDGMARLSDEKALGDRLELGDMELGDRLELGETMMMAGGDATWR